jgi:hypothetical protein
MYWGRDVDQLIKNIDLGNPAESLEACVESVASLLKNAPEKGDRRRYRRNPSKCKTSVHEPRGLCPMREACEVVVDT